MDKNERLAYLIGWEKRKMDTETMNIIFGDKYPSFNEFWYIENSWYLSPLNFYEDVNLAWGLINWASQQEFSDGTKWYKLLASEIDLGKPLHEMIGKLLDLILALSEAGEESNSLS